MRVRLCLCEPAGANPVEVVETQSRRAGTQRVALLLLGSSTVALVPAYLLVAPNRGFGNPVAVALLFALAFCAYRAEVHFKTQISLKIDAGWALALVAVAVGGPLAGIIVLLPWEIASRLIWREHRTFTPGALANLASYGWSAFAAAEVLRLNGHAALTPDAIPSLFTAGMALGLTQFAVGRLLYGTLYQGFRVGALLRAEFSDALSLVLVEVVLGTVIAVLFGAVGLPSFAVFALVILTPSLVLPALARCRSVTKLDQSGAATLYVRALGDVLRLNRDRRRVLAGAVHLIHHGRHAPSARWADRHDIEFASRYVGEHYDGGGGPGALAGDHIPLDSRVLAVAIRWAQLTASGSSQLPHAEALLGLELAAGSELDPRVVAAAAEIVYAELPFARDQAFQPVLHRLPLPRTLRRVGLPQALGHLDHA